VSGRARPPPWRGLSPPHTPWRRPASRSGSPARSAGASAAHAFGSPAPPCVRRTDFGTPRPSKAQIKYAIEGSLSRMGLDYVDLYQIHWPDRYVPIFGADAYDPAKVRADPVPFEEQLEAMQDLVRDGKVRYVGVSNETSHGVMEFAHLAESAGLPKIVSIQNQFHLLARSKYETDLAEVCSPEYKNVGLLAYSPLAGGVLSGKYERGEAPAGARFNM